MHKLVYGPPFWDVLDELESENWNCGFFYGA